jgi:predicted Zn-dependent protease
LSSEEFRTLRTEVDSRIGDNLGEAQSEDLWKGCILNFQHGEYERAYSYIEALAKREPDDPFVYYNLGHLGMKVSRKQEAIQAFNEFVKRRSQSWWTSVARDHLRRLQMT